MRQQEDRGIKTSSAGRDRECASEGPAGEGGGVLWKDVVAWYCQQHESELSTSEDLAQMQKLVSQVMRRLITKDGSLVYLGDPEADIPDEERLIAVHPNFTLF
ncbi:unnamed protein product [Discosporangium mesarthrocarpum]